MATNHNLPAHLHPEGPVLLDARVRHSRRHPAKARAARSSTSFSSLRTTRWSAYLNVKDLKSEDYLNNHFVVLCTKKGIIKRPRSKRTAAPRQWHHRRGHPRGR